MIKVRYKKYFNDYRNSNESKTFCDLEAVADWLFEMVEGDYKRNTYFVNPDKEHLRDSKLWLNSSCIQSQDDQYTYYVQQIEKDGVIIYSCGTFTNGICHWNEEVKQWLRRCNLRRCNPQFRFG